MNSNSYHRLFYIYTYLAFSNYDYALPGYMLFFM